MDCSGGGERDLRVVCILFKQTSTSHENEIDHRRMGQKKERTDFFCVYSSLKTRFGGPQFESVF